MDKLTAIDFDSLPLKDAMVIKQGSGARKLAVFADPNCGYCKRFERDLVSAQGRDRLHLPATRSWARDSNVKSRDIWCAKDAGKTWRAWMVDGVAPPKAMAKCDTDALERNLEFGKKHRIKGTPAVVFEDGTRVPGAMSLDKFEKTLAASSKKG